MEIRTPDTLIKSHRKQAKFGFIDLNDGTCFDSLQVVYGNNLDNFEEISTENGAPNVFTLAFKNIKSEVVLHMLEPKGFFVGNGSACSSKQLYSRLAMELNLPKEYAEGIIRICFSKFNTRF